MTQKEEFRLQQLLQKQKKIPLNSLELRDLVRLSQKKALKSDS
jgi:hypothetical protein